MKIETRTWETEDERLADRLVESRAQRGQRIANKRVDRTTARTIHAALGDEQGHTKRKNARPQPCTVASLVIWTPLWTQIKRRATREGTNASALVARVVADYLDGRRKA
jgi:hypothetical protein